LINRQIKKRNKYYKSIDKKSVSISIFRLPLHNPVNNLLNKQLQKQKINLARQILFKSLKITA